MPSYGSLAFEEQIAFFRDKLNLPTERWDDLLGEGHDRAFVVAGAMQADLLADLRAAVTKAIETGSTLEEFRRDFDTLVEKNGWTGWTGEGSAAGRAWRTKVIYATNLRTSYAAGRYQQLKDMQAERPFWRYRHNDTVLHPRPEHEALDGVILPASDPFWSTAYPPSGFNCFPAGTEVATPSGWSPIESLHSGDLVIGGSGNIQSVTFPYRRAFNGNIIRIISKEVEVSATPNHRFLTLRGWIRADHIKAGDMLVQIFEISSRNIPVRDVKHADSACHQFSMSSPRHRFASAFGKAFDPDLKRRNENINPIGKRTKITLGVNSPLHESIHHRFLARGWNRLRVDMRGWIRLMHGTSRFGHFGADFRTPCRRGDFQLFRCSAHSFIGFFSLAKSRMASSFSKIQGCFAKYVCRLFAPDFVPFPLQGNSFGSLPWLDTVPVHHPHDRPVVAAPPSTQPSDRDFSFYVEGTEGFASGAPLDRFDSLDDFVAWAWAHCRLSRVDAVVQSLYTGIVCNLSVEQDETYCLRAGVVHNCRCYVEALSQGSLDRKGLKVSETPQGFTPDKGWDYAPGASVATETQNFVQAKADALPPELARSWMKSMTEGLKTMAFEGLVLYLLRRLLG